MALLALTGAACKGKHSRVTVENEEPAPRMASVVRMTDPTAGKQLVSGFFAVEANSWRWTAGKFSAVLGTPPTAAQNGATLTFAFSIPEVAIQKLKDVSLTASVNGMTLKTSKYDKSGPNIFTADVPPSLLTGDSVKIDFSLDKTLPPNIDLRGLGVIATSVGITVK